MRKQTTMFLDTSVESLTLAVELFNRPTPAAREHAVLMMLAHSFEMLLKAIIFETRGTVREPGEETSHSLGKCIAICADDLQLLTADDRILLAAIKQDRDCATHDVIAMGDEFLWIHMRAGITIYRRLLSERFAKALIDVIPARAIPVSEEPPHDLQQLVSDQLVRVAALLAPRTRKTAEARALIRPLLSLDGAVDGRLDQPTEVEVNRAEKAIRGGTSWELIFPGLATLNFAEAPGRASQEITLRVGRDAEGVPVRRARSDEEALAYRSISPFDEYGVKLTNFGERLSLTRHQGLALIQHLDLKSDDRAYFVKKTRAGNIIFQGLSARALDLGRQALATGVDLDAITRAYNAR